MRALVALGSGALFGVGLIVADMVDPSRVMAFLDLFGAWDPTLAFVMGGAILPMLVAWRLSGDRRPLLGGSFPALRREIDGRLIGGSALFGAGWGLGGYCPGPALASLSIGGPPAVIFCAAMLVGMFAHNLLPEERALA